MKIKALSPKDIERNRLMLAQEDDNYQVEISDNEKKFRLEIGTALRNTMRMRMLNQSTITNDDELIERINNFLNECIMTNQMPTIEKASLSIGTTPKGLRMIKTGEDAGFSPYTQKIIEDLYTTIASISSEMAMRNAINPVVYIFTAKNYYDMVDKQEVSIEPVNVLKAEATQESIEAKYNELIED